MKAHEAEARRIFFRSPTAQTELKTISRAEGDGIFWLRKYLLLAVVNYRYFGPKNVRIADGVVDRPNRMTWNLS